MPQAVIAGSRVIMVACCSYHTMAVHRDDVSSAGHVWTFVRNHYCQLGMGNRTNCDTNRLGCMQVDVGQFGDVKILMVSCGRVDGLTAWWCQWRVVCGPLAVENTAAKTGWCRRHFFVCVCVDPQHFAHATISTIACEPSTQHP